MKKGRQMAALQGTLRLVLLGADPLIAGGELVTALPAAAGQNGPTRSGAHALPETMLIGPLAFAGLVSTLHGLLDFV